jgi:hypothetical protein
MLYIARDVPAAFEVFEYRTDFQCMQGQIMESNFIRLLLRSIQKHNFELSTPCTSSTTDRKNGMMSLLYMHMHELCLQNELIQRHYIIS